MKNKLSLAILSLLAVFLMVGILGGCGQKHVATTTTLAGKTISGNVTDLISGRVIPGVAIYAGGVTTYTSSSGAYTLQNVPSTCESLTFQCGGYAPISVFSTNESMDIELSLIPERTSTHQGYVRSNNSTIEGYMSNSQGNLVSESIAVTLKHPYYNSSNNISNGKFTINYYLDPEKLPMKAFLSGATSQESFIRELQLQSVGMLNVGTIEANQGVGTISGEVASPFGSGWLTVNWGIDDGQKRWYLNSFGGTSYSPYKFYVPPSPASYKYFMMAYAPVSYGGVFIGHVAQYTDNFEIMSGETKIINFSLPNLITIESPASGATINNANPIFSWNAPDPSYNLYIVFLSEGGGSNYLKWVGVTDKTLITYPSFSSGSGFENLNMKPNRGYTLQVFGYYIPGFELKASNVKIAGILDQINNSVKTAETIGVRAIRAETISEMFQAMKQTLSPHINFSTSRTF